MDEIELLSKLMNDSDIKELAKDLGMSDNEIKKIFV